MITTALTLLLALDPAHAAAPATVLDHKVEITVDSGRRLRESVTWTVRIDDPAACAAGVLAPAGLDGAVDGEAMVLEDVLIVPPTAAVGDTFTLKVSRRGDRGSHSGWLQSAPELPVEQATLVVAAPGWVPLTVWADPGATPDYAIGGTRKVTMTWRDLEAGDAAQAAWSTYEQWDDAGADLLGGLDRKLASKIELGRELAADIEGIGVGGIVERVFDHVALEPGKPGTWEDARSAIQVSKARSGRAVDRGVLLLSLLKVAGFDAVPGVFLPSTDRPFPVTVPAPSLLPQPMIQVTTKKGTVYVDPAAERAAVPARPASMLGATVWVPGTMPLALPERGIVDGQVNVSSAVSVDVDGSTRWTSTITSRGAATEFLRQLLAPLDEGGRQEALKRIIVQGRPGLERVQLSVSGITKTREPLRITVSGSDPSSLTPTDYGLRGVIAPVMAPGLASWLPPNLQVEEHVAVSPPQLVTILASKVAPSAFQTEALVARRYDRDGASSVLTVEVQRPYRDTSPSVDAAAASFLKEQATGGVELLLFNPASTVTIKALQGSTELSEAEKIVLTAQLWWSIDNERTATKTLVKGVKSVGFEPLLEGVVEFAEPGDPRPWDALLEVAADTPAWKLLVVEGMERAGLLRRAWLTSVPLHDEPDPEVRLRAVLVADRLQGPPPDPEDTEGRAAWKNPFDLLSEAEAAAEGLPDKPEQGEPRILFRQAEWALEFGEMARAESLLDAVNEVGAGGPRVEALRAMAAAKSGVPMDEVTDLIASAVEAAPTDPEVVAIAAAATAVVGATGPARDYALTAARIANDDPALWDDAAQRALNHADLGTAVYAARRASDLEPEDRVRAKTLRSLALLLGDKQMAEVGATRAGVPLPSGFPPSLDARMRDAPPEALLATLDVAEDAVVAEPRLLAMRAQMRIDAGHLDEGARDGMALAQKYSWKEGWALAFAATAGRQYSTVLRKELDGAAVDQSTAQAVRMEYGLVTGSPDPLRDARRLRDDPRAKSLLTISASPRTAFDGIEGWPADVPEPSASTPRGYRSNRVLGAPVGVKAWSNPDAAVAIVRVGAITGLLPPPLNQLYTMQPQPLERLDNGGQVVRLDGGVMPLYAAVAFDGAEEVYGLGFSRESAKHALEDALPQ